MLALLLADALLHSNDARGVCHGAQCATHTCTNTCFSSRLSLQIFRSCFANAQVKAPPGHGGHEAEHADSGPLSSAAATCPVYLMPPDDFLPFLVPFKGGPGRFCGGACSDVFQWSTNAEATCALVTRCCALLCSHSKCAAALCCDAGRYAIMPLSNVSRVRGFCVPSAGSV